jgi:hypothetical protein
VVVEDESNDAKMALARFVARRIPGQTRFAVALHVERLIDRKTCPACWRTTGFGMEARHLGQPLAHDLECEALPTRLVRPPIRYRTDPTLAALLQAARP